MSAVRKGDMMDDGGTAEEGIDHVVVNGKPVAVMSCKVSSPQHGTLAFSKPNQMTVFAGGKPVAKPGSGADAPAGKAGEGQPSFTGTGQAGNKGVGYEGGAILMHDENVRVAEGRLRARGAKGSVDILAEVKGPGLVGETIVPGPGGSSCKVAGEANLFDAVGKAKRDPTGYEGGYNANLLSAGLNVTCVKPLTENAYALFELEGKLGVGTAAMTDFGYRLNGNCLDAYLGGAGGLGVTYEGNGKVAVCYGEAPFTADLSKRPRSSVRAQVRKRELARREAAAEAASGGQKTAAVNGSSNVIVGE